MMLVYHVTPKQNLVKILTQGLLANPRSDGFTKFIKRAAQPRRRAIDAPAVYLTNDPRTLVDTQCGDNWVTKYDPVVLTLDVEGLCLVYEYAHVVWIDPQPCPRKGECITWVCGSNIEPVRILDVRSYTSII